MSNNFRFITPTELHFGSGKLNNLDDFLNRLESRRILVVTDKGLVAAGLIEKITKSIEGYGKDCIVYPEIKPNPTVENVHKGVSIVREERIDTVVAIGGGSPMDAAKSISALSTNEGSICDYELGKNDFKNIGLPLIVIPTTSGTGSEATMASVIMNEEENRKFDIVSKFLAPAIGIVDPETTFSLPPSMTAFTGMDALTHSIEGVTATLASPLTDEIHLGAIKLIWDNLDRVIQNPDYKEGRENLMLGSMMAGIGFPNSGLGAVHGLSYAISCYFHLGHGLANAILLPHVMRFNIPAAINKFVLISDKLRLKNREPEALVEEVLNYSKRIGVPTLSSFDVDSKLFPRMSEESMGEFSNCNTNPRYVSVEDAVEIYKNALAV